MGHKPLVSICQTITKPKMQKKTMPGPRVTTKLQQRSICLNYLSPKGWSASPVLNFRPSCGQGKAERQRVSGQQLGLCGAQRWRLLYLSGGSQGDLFSSGRENWKIIVYIPHTKEAGICQVHVCCCVHIWRAATYRCLLFFSFWFPVYCCCLLKSSWNCSNISETFNVASGCYF